MSPHPQRRHRRRPGGRSWSLWLDLLLPVWHLILEPFPPRAGALSGPGGIWSPLSGWQCCRGERRGESGVGAALTRLSPRPSVQELEKCDANHYIILFRDAGCQFRALYCYSPDSEDICKLTGTGPRSITRKMIDKLYKYSSDRKQFSLIPAKTMSVSVDALTIHSHLWQPKRPAVPRKSQPRK